MKYSPIFQQTQEGKDWRFIVPYGSMVGETEDAACEIGLGKAFVEGILLGFRFTGDCLELDDDGKVHVTGWPSKLGPWDVVILDDAKV